MPDKTVPGHRLANAVVRLRRWRLATFRALREKRSHKSPTCRFHSKRTTPIFHPVKIGHSSELQNQRETCGSSYLERLSTAIPCHTYTRWISRRATTHSDRSPPVLLRES